MKIFKEFKKLKKLKMKKLNGKNAALFLLNRKLQQISTKHGSYGKITDLQLDRQTKTLEFEILRGEAINTIAILGYHFTAFKGHSYLGWSSLSFNGPSQGEYRKVFHNIDRIEVSKRYLSLLEVVL